MIRSLLHATGTMLALLLSLTAAQPAIASDDPVFDRLITRLAEIRGFSCDFRQEVHFAEGGEKVYTGTLLVRRPGYFRWQYVTPYEQLYVSDGGLIWHYEADLMQAERMNRLDAVDPAAMKLLDGRIGAKDVRLLAPGRREGDSTGYRVRIGDGPELTLAFRKDGSLHWLESEDMLANRNRMILLDIDKKVPAEEQFRFVPPQGVEVVDYAGQGDVLPLGQSNKDGE